MTANDEQEFENFLQTFRPIAPRALPRVAPHWRWGPVLAVAALVLLAVGLSLLTTDAPPFPPLAEGRVANTLGGIGHATQGDPAKLDTVLGSRAHTSLPDVEHSKGALRVLASE